MSEAVADSTGCPPPWELFQFSLGNLSSVQIDKIADHLGACASCQALMASFENQANAGLRERPDEKLSQETGFVQLLDALRHVPSTALGQGALADPSKLFDPAAGGGWAIGEYEVGQLIGEGAMGRVYRAWHRLLKREVVIKLLSPQRRTDHLSVARFVREIEAIGRVGEHPHLVRAMDAGRHQGDYYIVMEYIQGADLRHVMAQACPLNCEDVAEIGRQVALALAHICDHHMVHRDIKPSNVFLTKSGTVKVLDLGLALFQRRSDDPTSRFHVVGTADYIAPEQWGSGQPVDTRADIYALGCTLYQLLAGQAPFAQVRGFENKREAHLHKIPRRLLEVNAQVPPELDQIVMQMLAKDPDRRIQHPQQLAELLSPFATDARLSQVIQPLMLPHRDATQGASDPTHLDRSLSRWVAPGSGNTRRVVMRWLAGASLAGVAGPLLWKGLTPVQHFRREFAESEGGTFEYNPRTHDLVATSDGLLGLSWFASPQSPRFTLHVSIHKNDSHTLAGLFWGARPMRAHGSDLICQHVLTLQGVPDVPLAQRLSHTELSLGLSQESTIRTEHPISEMSFDFDRVPAAIRLAVTVEHGRLTQLVMNGKPIPQLAMPPEHVATSGPGACGVFVRGGMARFASFSLEEY